VDKSGTVAEVGFAVAAGTATAVGNFLDIIEKWIICLRKKSKSYWKRINT
jgi:nucleoside 2-deoxyribosyltransferase